MRLIVAIVQVDLILYWELSAMWPVRPITRPVDSIVSPTQNLPRQPLHRHQRQHQLRRQRQNLHLHPIIQMAQ